MSSACVHCALSAVLPAFLQVSGDSVVLFAQATDEAAYPPVECATCASRHVLPYLPADEGLMQIRYWLAQPTSTFGLTALLTLLILVVKVEGVSEDLQSQFLV